ncbi:MAG: hypothetical protein COB17_03420 [Sulfurimonas sp.]|nr:MAG: hypothetical protein COB17_03420 [Sulfurimonas sp.]
MKESNLFFNSIKDFFTLKMLKYSTLPFLISIIILYILFFLIAGIGLDWMGTMDVSSTQTSIENGIPHTESFQAKLEGLSIIKFFSQYAVTSWIASFLVYAIGGFLTLYVSIFIAIIIVGFLTPYILKELQTRHYQDIEMIGFSNIFSSLFLILKYSLTMLILFIVLIPFYFIPILNIIAFNFPLYYFFHKMLSFDVSSNICTKEEDKQISYFNKNSLRFKTLMLYIISLIPFAIFFGAVFYVIYLGNTYFIFTRKLRLDNK